MKQTLLAVMIVAMAAFLTSCASTHAGMITSSTALSQANFKYVKQNVQGESKATYVLGIGGMKRAALVQEAKEKLLSQNKLQANQALANYNLDWKAEIKWFGLIGKVKCYVSADIVEFTK